MGFWCDSIGIIVDRLGLTADCIRGKCALMSTAGELFRAHLRRLFLAMGAVGLLDGYKTPSLSKSGGP